MRMMTFYGRTAALAACLTVAMVALPADADAQYFGRNKVQYRTFDFRVLQTETFDVYFYPEEEVAVRDAARMAERWYTRLSAILDHRFDERQPIILYGSHPAFQQTTTVSGELGEGTGGVTESAQQRVILPLTGIYSESDHVLGHEIVHAFQYDMSGLGRARGQFGASARALGTAPLWFIEGMAEYLTLGPIHPLTAMWVRDGALSGNLPTIEQMTRDTRFFPYRWGQALWAYVGGRWGDAAIGQILRLVGQGIAYDQAMERTLNIPLDELSQDWHAAIRRTYLPMLAERPEAREVARPLLTAEREGGRVNIGPAISPDGQWVVFLSELDLDIELWLANARTGEVVRRLQEGAAFDPHYESLRYIRSAGSWAPDNTRFVFSALRRGQDRLIVIDTRNGRTLNEITIPGVIEIGTPSWSPDNRTIVFSGITGGISDLYTYDLESGETRRLTNDLYANLHPSVSPDGRTIAFVTDQGPGTDFAALRYGGLNIATIPIAGGEPTVVLAESGNAINPSWSASGTDLYLVSDRSGISNIYRLDLASGELFQVTRLFGGVSGITETSPAITVARTGDRLLFSAFEDRGYNIYSLTTREELAGTPAGAAADLAARTPAVLPPSPRPSERVFNEVLGYLTDPVTGLPAPGRTAQWEVVGASSRLHLDYLGQPTVGYSTGGFTGMGGLYGAVAAAFSDVLGYHNVFAAVQAQGELDEVGFAATYLNQKHRWNWGVAAQRIPYVALGRNLAFEPESSDGTTTVGTLRDQILRHRFFDWSLRGLTQYPFSRAQRVEFALGARRLATDIQVFEVSGPAAVQNGRIIAFQPAEQDRFELAGSSASWNMGEAMAALVYDNALFGYTSPFAGQRYRFEASPVVGSLSYVQALADYRRYFWFQPFTFAIQGMHFGRYGDDAEIFSPIFLGQPSLVRGYWSVYSDCRGGPGGCDRDVLDQLFGSRIAVAKAEIRFPLVRQLVIGPIGFPPIEGYAFGDAGLAWTANTSPTFERFDSEGELQRDPMTGALLDDNRYLLTSGGVGARVNLFGYFIVEINYVNAFERDRGWHWQFALQPGF